MDRREIQHLAPPDHESEDVPASENADSKSREKPKPPTNHSLLLPLIGFSMVFIGTELSSLLFTTLLLPISASLHSPSHLTPFLFASAPIATAAIAPYVGRLTLLLGGPKPLALTGLTACILGMVLCACTPNAQGYIAGQALAGAGNGVLCLVFLAGLAEMVPQKRRRGVVVAGVVAGLVPFAPAAVYGQMIASRARPGGWRWCAGIVAVWDLIAAVVLAVWYRPGGVPYQHQTVRPRTDEKIQAPLQPTEMSAPINGRWKRWKKTLERINLPGGLFSVTGFVLVLVSLNTGGQLYPWRSPLILVPLIIGLILIILFIIWEVSFASHPLFPRRIAAAGLPFYAALVVVLLASVNVVPVLVFWAIQSVSVYGAGWRENAVHVLPVGICILGGAMVSACLLSVVEGGRVRWVILGFCVMQTVGVGSMAAVNPNAITTVWAPLIFALTGAGGVLLPSQIIVTILTPPDDSPSSSSSSSSSSLYSEPLLAMTSALTVSLRSLGQVIGLSLFYNVFLTSVTSNTTTFLLAPDVIPTLVAAGFTSPAQVQSLLSGLMVTPVREIVDATMAGFPEEMKDRVVQIVGEGARRLFGMAFRRVYFVSVAFGAGGCVACWFVGGSGAMEREMERKKGDDHAEKGRGIVA